jgi:hypothetical protein
MPGYEDNGETLEVLWKKLDEFGPGKSTLYPEGLLAIASQ